MLTVMSQPEHIQSDVPNSTSELENQDQTSSAHLPIERFLLESRLSPAKLAAMASILRERAEIRATEGAGLIALSTSGLVACRYLLDHLMQDIVAGRDAESITFSFISTATVSMATTGVMLLGIRRALQSLHSNQEACVLSSTLAQVH